MTLTDFLLARIAEDEAAWLPAATQPRRAGKTHARRHLAECEAKRRIVELHPPRETHRGYPYCGGCLQSEEDDRALYYDCPTLRALALPYADHPDYRDEWKP